MVQCILQANAPPATVYAFCHGSKSADIAPAVRDQLQTKLPLDMAYDYKVGDLRGMWHITFEKKMIRSKVV
ncbi:MAG: hypothetical protein IPF70_12915 [Saprospiraceae bacterium]|nr:hypothetical protein [Saprospiraceae bacterium]